MLPRILPRIPFDWLLVVVVYVVAIGFTFVTLSSNTFEFAPTVWLVVTGFINPVSF